MGEGVICAQWAVYGIPLNYPHILGILMPKIIVVGQLYQVKIVCQNIKIIMLRKNRNTAIVECVVSKSYQIWNRYDNSNKLTSSKVYIVKATKRL